MKTKFLLFSILAFFSVKAAAQWELKSPQNTNVGAIASDGNNLVAGCAGGRIYLSSNNGLLWEEISINDSIISWVNAIAINGSTLVAGFNDIGVYISNDYGNTWTASNNGITSLDVISVLIKGTDLYIVSDGVYLSTNNGLSWSKLNNVSGRLITEGANMYMCNKYGSDIYMSANNGSTWGTLITPTLANVISVDGNKIAYAKSHDVYLSSDGGNTWIQRQINVNNTVIRMALKGSKIFAAFEGDGIYYSSDDGLTWSCINNNLRYYSYICDLYVKNDTLFSATKSGIYFTSILNPGAWIEINNGIHSIVPTCFYLDGLNLYSGSETGNLSVSSNAGNTWTDINLNIAELEELVYSVAANGNKVYANPELVVTSFDGGTTWTFLDSTFTLNNWVSDIKIIANTLFVGSNSGVYKSNNDGALWTAAGLSNHYIEKLFYDGTTLYAVGDGIFFSSNLGNTWSDISINNIPDFFAHDILKTGNNLVIGTQNGIFVSDNNGNSWTQKNTGLTNDTSVVDLAVEGSNLFAAVCFGFNGGDVGGLFMSSDNGDTWQNIGFVDKPVRSIVTDGTYIYAGVIPKGIFRRKLSEVVSTSSPITNNYYTNIYPNPYSNAITFELVQKNIQTNWAVVIYDIMGKKVKELFEINQEKIMIDRNNMPCGVYSYQIIVKGSVLNSGKLIVE